MQNLNDALTDLRTTIIEDGFETGMVESIAKDWGLNPILLSRKFIEKHNVQPAYYKGIKKADIAARVEAEAVAEADRIRALYTKGSCPITFGDRFKNKDGTEFIAVCIAAGGLQAVRVSDAQWRVFGGTIRGGYTVAQKFKLI